MAARIRSLQNGITPLDEVSRDDLVTTDVVTVQSLDSATTYAWTLVFAPEGSAATFSGNPATVSPGTFTVDVEGAYLIRLVVDASLITEDTQYVRLRALTSDLGLTLVSAGERRDGTGIIPVDIDVEGWANEQNNNLLALEAAAVAIPDASQIDFDPSGLTHVTTTEVQPAIGEVDAELVALNSLIGGLGAPVIGYTPGTPGDWAGSPTSVQAALDRLAAAVEGLLGGAIP